MSWSKNWWNKMPTTNNKEVYANKYNKHGRRHICKKWTAKWPKVIRDGWGGVAKCGLCLQLKKNNFHVEMVYCNFANWNNCIRQLTPVCFTVSRTILNCVQITSSQKSAAGHFGINVWKLQPSCPTPSYPRKHICVSLRKTLWWKWGEYPPQITPGDAHD